MLEEAGEGRSAPDDLTERLRSGLDGVLRGVLEDAPAVALATFPNHWNLGDTAVWAGQRAALARLGVRVAYACDFHSYRRDELERALPEGPILLSGGGNFGDVYPREQVLRERILDDFPRRTVVQLPQSVWFRAEARLDAMRRRCERAGRFVMLVRDRHSLDLVRARFAVPVRLAPDMAFGLPDLRARRLAPATDVLWLLRRDLEATDRAARRAAARGVRGAVRDWTRPGVRHLRRHLGEYARAQWLAWRLRLPGRARGREPAAPFDRLASLRMGVALGLLSTGRVMVTDRLHGHVLALLLGVPHVCIDNRDGKVRHLYETWTSTHPLARWAGSVAEARALADALRAGTAAREGAPGR